MKTPTQIIPAAGTEGGPCLACRHADCVAERAVARSACKLCGEPLGHGVEFVATSAARGTHAACLARELGPRISTNLRALAKARGLSLGQVAALAFPGMIDLSARARQRRACMPSSQLRDLDEVAQALGVDVADLLAAPGAPEG